MNVLYELISGLDGHVLGHIQKKLEPGQTKSFELFRIYKGQKDEKPDDVAIIKLLYGTTKNSNGAFYRLKNRLLSDINDALMSMYISAEDSGFPAERFYLLSKIFISKGMFDLAEYYLQKAIKSAEVSEQFALLDILYGEMAVLCKDTLTNNPEHFIQLRKNNTSMLDNIRTIDEILAVLTYRLKSTQNLSAGLSISSEIDNTLESFSANTSVFNSKQFKTKFYKTVCQILIQQKKYEELESFILKIYDEFDRERFFTRQNHDIKIEQLVYLINSLLFQHKFREVLEINERLYQEISRYDKLLFDKYEYFYYQSKINSYAALDMDKAIEVQKGILENKKIIKEPNFIVFNYANLAYLYFIKRNYRQVVKTLQKVYTDDYFSRMETYIKSELMMIELIARLEIDDEDVFEYRMRQIRNFFESEGKAVKRSSLVLMEILDMIFTNPLKKNTPDIERKYDLYKKQKTKESAPVFNIDPWLKGKLGI